MMRIFITPLIATAIACTCGCAASATRDAAPVQLTVMTYNIHHAEGMDKKLDLARIAEVIRRCEADLVALQEVDGGTKRTNRVMQAQELARLTKMRHVYGPAMDFDGGKYGNAILSRFEIMDSRVVPLPYTAGERREPRSAVAALVRLPGGRDVTFISTHFDHTKDSPDRIRQAAEVNRQLGDVPQPALLAGDFNCEPESEPMAEIARKWTMVSDDNTPTCPADKPHLRIDHVLVKPDGKWRVVEAKVTDEPVASDHRPVVVKLRLE